METKSRVVLLVLLVASLITQAATFFRAVTDISSSTSLGQSPAHSLSKEWLHHFFKRRELGIRGGASGRDEGPYSFSLTTFSPRGSLRQIEYAMNSANEGALSVALVYDSGIAMASIRKAGSSLVMNMGTAKISRVTDSIAALYSGLAADSRVMTKKTQECCLGYQGKFGNGAAIPITTLVSDVALVMQEYTQMAGVRPFGAALLLATVDADSRPRLFRLEPSGIYSAWKACAIGRGSAEAETMLHEGFKESMDRNLALQRVLSTVLRCSSNDIRPEDVEIAFVEEGTIETVESTRVV